MAKLKRKSIFPIENWSVKNYGITLRINPSPGQYTLYEKMSLDVEDNEMGVFAGLGLYSPKAKEAYYWSNLVDAQILKLYPFIAHNGRTDLDKLRKWGFNVDESFLFYDTQLIEHIIDSSLGPKEYGLKALAKSKLGIEYPHYEDIVGKHKSKTLKAPKCPQTVPGCCGRITLDKQPLDLAANYNAMDCYVTYKLYEKQCIQIL